MSGAVSFPELSLGRRPALFDALLAHHFEQDVVEARFGDRRGWVVIDPTYARDLLRRRDLAKGRSARSRGAVGGYPSLDGAAFHRGRRDVVVALSRASTDPTAMAASLAATIGSSPPPRSQAPAAFTRWMLHDLAGGDSTALELGLLTNGIAAAFADAEAAQAGTPWGRGAEGDRAALVSALTVRVTDADTAFLSSLRARGWSTDLIVEELVVLALAGWESTAAAVTTGLALGLGTDTGETEISELLRLYPPSWLIVRELTGEEPWGSAGDLVVVSPWLTHRSAAWHEPLRFDPQRTDAVASLPFGSGPRRCPADLYARKQISVALGAFGGGETRPARPALIGSRSAALIPDQETTS